MVRIVEFLNEKEEFNGFRELSIAHQPIKNIKGLKYVITEPQCKLLQSRNIKYNVLQE